MLVSLKKQGFHVDTVFTLNTPLKTCHFGEALTRSSGHRDLARVDPYPCPFFLLPSRRLRGPTVHMLRNEYIPSVHGNELFDDTHVTCPRLERYG